MFSFARQVLQSLHRPVQSLDTMARNLCTNTLGYQKVIGTSTRSSLGLRNQPLMSSGWSTSKKSSDKNLNPQSVRSYMRVYYRPSAWKRYNKHNIENRMTTSGGVDVLWKRVLKGRHNLAVYERILPNTVNGKVLAKHQMRFKKHPLTRQKLPKPGLF